MNPSEASKFIDLINYQKEAVVSRTLVSRPTGTITLFAFDEGQSLSEHSAPYDAFANCVEGKIEVIISGKKHTLEEGSVILMPANEPHALKAVRRAKMMLVMIRS